MIKKAAIFIILILACTVFLWAQNGPDECASLFVKANELYANGKYQEAAKSYETILKNQKNGYLYYNLGNCYLKINKIGLAIVNYRRAQKYIPRFPDLNLNLKFAYEETRDKIEDKSLRPLYETVFFWYYQLNSREIIISFLVINFLFFLFAALRIYTQNETLRWLLIIISIFYVLGAGSAIAKIYQENYRKNGIVIENQIAVRSGDNISNVTLFNLHEGAEFEVKEERGDWLKITLADGKIGWVQKGGIEII